MAHSRQNPVCIALLILVAVVILIFFGTGTTNHLKTSASNFYERFSARSRGIINATPFDYKAAMAALNEERVDQEDPRLVKLIRDYYIESPSDKEYNLTDLSVQDTSQGQSKYVDRQLNSKTGGFFIECGALDGDRLSNSMFFERARNWNGILIEADPSSYKTLREKNRKAYSINACLSPFPYPTVVPFMQGGAGSHIKGEERQNAQRDTRNMIHVQCFPLTSILLALGRTTVDYFSLDIEGAELKVLKTIPMKKIDIQIMSVEVLDNTQASRDLAAYLAEVGFKRLTHMMAFYMSDTIYAKV